MTAEDIEGVPPGQWRAQRVPAARIVAQPYDLDEELFLFIAGEVADLLDERIREDDLSLVAREATTTLH